MNTTIVEHDRTKHVESVLKKCGIDQCNLLPSRAQFDLKETLVKIQADIPNVIHKTLTVKRQCEVASHYINYPLKRNYILAIGSFPSDLRAKQLAVMLVRNAINQINTKKINRSYPLWHKIYGNYKDSLRDDANLAISMLVLSNVTSDSSQLKIEKLRDLLEQYCNIPRIVVLGGTDPITFFANKLHLPLTSALYIGADNRVHSI